MPQNINSVVLVGNLTRDPELRHTPSGTAVTTLRIAVNDRVKRGEEWQDAAYYFDVTVWGRDAENCAQYLAKGRPVGVQGKLTWREWDAQDGTKRHVNLPWTPTGRPLARYWAQFSAVLPQTVTSK